jgi:hypothetical protein
MTLDELLKEHAAWLESAVKQPLFGKVDEKQFAFPEEQRQRRIADLKMRISDLEARKEEINASYVNAIKLERLELESLMAAKPVTAAAFPETNEKRKTKK